MQLSAPQFRIYRRVCLPFYCQWLSKPKHSHTALGFQGVAFVPFATIHHCYTVLLSSVFVGKMYWLSSLYNWDFCLASRNLSSGCYVTKEHWMCYELLGPAVFGFPVTLAIFVEQYYYVSHWLALLTYHKHCSCIVIADWVDFWVAVENSRIHLNSWVGSIVIWYLLRPIWCGTYCHCKTLTIRKWRRQSNVQLTHLPRSYSRRVRFFKVLFDLCKARELYSTHGWALICSLRLFILRYAFILFGVNVYWLHSMELLLVIRRAHSWWFACNRLHSILYFCWVLRSIILLTTWVEDTVISTCVAL